MIVRNPDQRVAVLVDVQNLYYSAKNLYGARVNFKNLLKIAVQNRVLTRAIAYVINSESKEKENDFFISVNTAGFEIKEKDIQVFFDGSKKGDWDLGIAMDAIRLGSKVDSIVLVSGDGDFRPVVNYLQQALGCLVEVIAFKQTANHDLIDIADDFINIEDYKRELLFKSKLSVRTHKVSQNVSRNTNGNSNGITSGNSNHSTSVKPSYAAQKNTEVKPSGTSANEENPVKKIVSFVVGPKNNS